MLNYLKLIKLLNLLLNYFYKSNYHKLLGWFYMLTIILEKSEKLIYLNKIEFF